MFTDRLRYAVVSTIAAGSFSSLPAQDAAIPTVNAELDVPKLGMRSSG